LRAVTRRLQLAASAVFFVSGAAGLVYQVVWSRLLNQVFGISAHAIAAVLATYLGGLALGSSLLGRIADRHPRPLRLYGLLELGIAATALAGAWLVHGIEPAHAWAASRLAPDSVALVALRVLLASAVVLPPTFLMGATLPAMTRAFVDRLGSLGRGVGSLYALNTAGAVVGSAAAGFVLIRAVGVHSTLWLAVGANVAVGVAALLLSRHVGGSAPRSAELAPAVPAVAAAAPGAGLRDAWLLAAMALSGFASLSLEVIWSRMLVLVLGTSTYAFVTMLSSFLVGIALGSWLARRVVDRLGNARRAFGWLQLGIAAATLATIPLVRLVLANATSWFAALEAGGVGAIGGQFAVSFLVMLVPTTLVGATFPLAARIRVRDLDTLAAGLGQLYGANTAGNIVGAIAGGFVLLPRLGMQRGIATLVIANLAAAACALLPARERWLDRRVLLRALPVSVLLWTCATLLALWRPAPLPGTGPGPHDTLRYYREGLVSTVSVFQQAEDGRQLVMSVDGVTIGQSAVGVDRKQQFLAHAPFLLAARPPRDVLSIGLGTGILVGEVARHPAVERVDCVELSPSVIEGARTFAEHNGGVLGDPRLRVVTDDGVNFLRRSAAAWDAIVSDGKSRSGHAGNAAFYSADYYRSARAHLAPDGLMIQWVPLDVAPEDLRVIVRTFSAAFAHAYLWLGPESCFLVGTQQPLVLDLPRARRVLEDPASEGLRRHGWRDESELAAFLLADGAALSRWAGAGPVNSLEHPVLEFHALGHAGSPRDRLAANFGALAALRRAGAADARVEGADERTVAAAGAVGALLDGLALLARGEARGAALLDEAVAAAPPGAGALRQLAAEALARAGRELDLQGRQPEAAGLYAQALIAWPELVEGHLNLARIAGLQGRRQEAREHLARALSANPLSGTAHAWLGRLYAEEGAPERAAVHLAEAVRLAPLTAELHEDLGLSLAVAGRPRDALREFQEALRLAPDWPAALDRVALMMAVHPDPRERRPDEAVRLAERALELAGGDDPMSLEVAAIAYAAGARFEDAERTERKVLEVAIARRDEALAAAARAAIELYRRGMTLPSDLADLPR
jgi:spermidine synthase